MNIQGKKVTLRALERTDMEELRSFHNDPEIGYLLGGWSHPISSDQQNKWFDGLANDPHHLRFAIDTPTDGFIGISTITNIDFKNRSAYHGIMIGKKNMHGHGYGRDTVMATMKYAFEELGLHRLDGDIVEHNIPSYHLYVQKCGWKKEGVLREHVYRKNQYYDRIIVGILKSDYDELCEQNNYWNEEKKAEAVNQ